MKNELFTVSVGIYLAKVNQWLNYTLLLRSKSKWQFVLAGSKDNSHKFGAISSKSLGLDKRMKWNSLRQNLNGHVKRSVAHADRFDWICRIKKKKKIFFADTEGEDWQRQSLIGALALKKKTDHSVALNGVRDEKQQWKKYEIAVFYFYLDH